MDNNVKMMLMEFANLEEVKAIVLGGSRARNTSDSKSDYNIYIYCDKEVDIYKRKEIISNYVNYVEYNNTFWEIEDNAKLKSDVDIDIVYRHTDFLDKVYQNVYVNSIITLGYSTCTLENIYSCKIIYEENQVITKYKKKIEKYPEKLREAIVMKNIQLLYDKMPSLGYQVIKAIQREDLINIANRVGEYFAIYCDIAFALNYKYNIGEKKLIQHLTYLEVLPYNAVQKIELLLKNCTTDIELSVKLVDEISEDMNKLVRQKFPTYNKSIYR